MTILPIADRWFEIRRVSDDITLLWEPHVVPLIRCNIWHVRGRDRDLLIDTGLGMASLKAAARHLFEKPHSPFVERQPLATLPRHALSSPQGRLGRFGGDGA